MNTTTCPSSSLPPCAGAAPPDFRPARWTLASLQRQLSNVRFTSVDLVDTPFASLPNRAIPAEADVGPLSGSDRPGPTRKILRRMV